VAVTSVQIDAAPADLLDRMAVLEIKSARLVNDEQLRHVRAELVALREARDRSIPRSSELERLSAALRKVNEELWELEESVRRHEAARTFGEAFIQSARGIIHSNDRRASLKRAINQLLGARFQEEKSFPLPEVTKGETSAGGRGL
jgi:chromatin segregation and condensation protein Rec8/ScpA/Scc1 (kleisin family)